MSISRKLFGAASFFGAGMLLAAAPALASSAVYTQKCPNGDRIHVDMGKKTLALTRGHTTWRATYDDSFAYTWSPHNPPPPAGAKFATQGSVASDGVFFGDGDVDSNVVCPIVK
jgi:hypothetical protein